MKIVYVSAKWITVCYTFNCVNTVSLFLLPNSAKQFCMINYFLFYKWECWCINLINVANPPNIDKEWQIIFIPSLRYPGSLSIWAFITRKPTFLFCVLMNTCLSSDSVQETLPWSFSLGNIHHVFVILCLGMGLFEFT